MSKTESEVILSAKTSIELHVNGKVEVFPVGLSPRKQEILSLTALGLNKELIAKEANISLATVQTYCGFITKAFGVNSMLEAVIKGVETGNVGLGEATKDLGINTIEKLTEKEKEILDTIIKNAGINTNYKELAEGLGISIRTINARIRDISRKLGLNRTRAVLLYLRYKKENSQIQSSGVIFQESTRNAVGE